MLVGNKIVKPSKTKFKRYDENDYGVVNHKQKQKKKHQDKSVYRLLKQEEKEYVG
jgi:hypothetical protein